MKGAHWSQCVRGMTVVAIKLLSDNIDKDLIEQLSNTYAERIMSKEIERRKRNKVWRAIEKSIRRQQLS